MSTKTSSQEPLTWLDHAAQKAKNIAAVPVAVKKKKLRTLNNWVLIRKHPRETQITEHGLVVERDAERSDVGTIMAVAVNLRGANGEPLDVKAGDVVIYTHFGLMIEDVQEITDDPSLQMVRGEEIYAVVEDAEES